MIICWDIETCPLAVETFSDRQRRRHNLLLDAERAKAPNAPLEDLSRRVRSLHPALGWICCIAAQRMDRYTGELFPPKAWTAATPADEEAMLLAFWKDIRQFSGMETWVTFNGKGFDVEWLVTRSLHHRIQVSNNRMLQRNPYSNEGHVDLAGLWKKGMGLADVCDLLGVASPKTALDGGGVAEAVASGRIADVATYCMADVTATLECYLIAHQFASPAFR
ncbi:MAG: ribonuclease H-like domain-containing protein [Rhodothermales bacterium]|nr:ribonuclease H-like domain-containing protein [Rhodothermales bacterium]